MRIGTNARLHQRRGGKLGGAQAHHQSRDIAPPFQIRFRPIDRREARTRLGLDPGARYLLFPADPNRPVKRYDRARELAEAARATLIAYGQRPPEEIPLMINAANAVLVTSDREGFGLAPLEALACDTPVLATEVGVAPLVLSGIDGTLCGPLDLAHWAAALTPHLEQEDPRVQGRARAALFCLREEDEPFRARRTGYDRVEKHRYP